MTERFQRAGNALVGGAGGHEAWVETENFRRQLTPTERAQRPCERRPCWILKSPVANVPRARQQLQRGPCLDAQSAAVAQEHAREVRPIVAKKGRGVIDAAA